jgi:hypothetical protein
MLLDSEKRKLSKLFEIGELIIMKADISPSHER